MPPRRAARTIQPRRARRLVPLAGTTLLVAGCSGPLSTLDPAGPSAAVIANFFWVMVAGSFVLFALVMALFAMVYLRPGWGAGLSGYRWIVYGGLGLPALVLPPLAGYSLWVGERILPTPERDAVRIEAIGRMWFWTFRYPDHGGHETIDVIHLPAGEPVEIFLTSEDVIHSFWIPRVAPKRDNIPGHINIMRIQADTPGILEGQCAEFCGLAHADMRFEVRVHPPEEMEAAILETPQGFPARTPDEPPLPEGLPPEPMR
jgi:cytochrome c oxidase subunit 2